MTRLADDLRYGLDPAAFAREALGFPQLDPWQVRALRSRAPRMVWNVARQLGKSTIAAILALHGALYTPGSLTLLVSPSLRQSGELFRKCAEMLDSMSPRPNLTEDNRLSLAFENRSRIVSLPGSEGTIRGFSGATLIVEDEAARVSDELHMAIRPMLAVSGGRLLLMSTPFGMRGHFHDVWHHGEGWERVCVPATECPRITPDFLADERRALGPWWYGQEYECTFGENAHSVFPLELIESAFDATVKPLFPGGWRHNVD